VVLWALCRSWLLPLLVGGVTRGEWPASPLPPVAFGCWRSLRSCSRRKPVYPCGKGRKILRDPSWRGSWLKNFRHAGPRLWRGLDGLERERKIPWDSSQMHVKTGDDGQELCDGRAAPKQPATQWTPFSARPASTLTGSHGTPSAWTAWGLPRAPDDRNRTSCGYSGPPPATTHGPRPPAADRPPTKGERPFYMAEEPAPSGVPALPVFPQQKETRGCSVVAAGI
jgi:hypothetical protein